MGWQPIEYLIDNQRLMQKPDLRCRLELHTPRKFDQAYNVEFYYKRIANYKKGCPGYDETRQLIEFRFSSY